jgi:hypothetical protein
MLRILVFQITLGTIYCITALSAIIQISIVAFVVALAFMPGFPLWVVFFPIIFLASTGILAITFWVIRSNAPQPDEKPDVRQAQ